MREQTPDRDDQLTCLVVGMLVGQPQRQVVGLGPGVDEVGDTQTGREGGTQPLGILHQVVVEEPGVRVQHCHLVD